MMIISAICWLLLGEFWIHGAHIERETEYVLTDMYLI